MSTQDRKARLAQLDARAAASTPCPHGVHVDFTPCQVCEPQRFAAEAHLHDTCPLGSAACREAEKVALDGIEAKYLQEIHKLTGRGEGHGSMAATAACIIDSVLSMKEKPGLDYEAWYHKLNDTVHAAIAFMDPVPANAEEAVAALVEDRDFWDHKAGTEHARANALEKIVTAKIAELADLQAKYENKYDRYAEQTRGTIDFYNEKMLELATKVDALLGLATKVDAYEKASDESAERTRVLGLIKKWVTSEEQAAKDCMKQNGNSTNVYFEHRAVLQVLSYLAIDVEAGEKP